MSARATSAKVESRRVKVAEVLAEGQKKTRGQIAAEVGTNLAAVKRDLAALASRFQAENSEAFTEYKKAQLSVLELMEESLVTGQADPDVVNAWRGVRSDISKLLGLDAPTKHLTARVDAEGSPLFLKFKKACAGLDDTQMEEVYGFASQIARQRQGPVVDASWFPAQERKEISE